jgi:hypothetical protein
MSKAAAVPEAAQEQLSRELLERLKRGARPSEISVCQGTMNLGLHRG